MNDKQSNDLRTVKTARDEQSINEAVKMGFRPLVRPVVPSPKIRSKFRVLQNKLTGEIDAQGDYRAGTRGPDWEVVIDWTQYYPHRWGSPFAAYLIPTDLQEGEVVILEDLIEDLVGASWNQGDIFRLKSCKARWNGNDFVLEYDPEVSPSRFIG